MIIFLKNCNKFVNHGILIRIILTILTFELLKQQNNPKDIFLQLPILLTILDLADGLVVKYNQYKKKPQFLLFPSNCTRLSKYYHYIDKGIDILSYIYAYVSFYDTIKDSLLEYFIIYRLIGVLMFIITGQKQFIIILFDFVKEYMLYRYFVKPNIYVLVLCIILKIAFEYYFHTYVNTAH